MCVTAWDERVNLHMQYVHMCACPGCMCVCVLMCTPLLLALRAPTEKGCLGPWGEWAALPASVLT